MPTFSMLKKIRNTWAAFSASDKVSVAALAVSKPVSDSRPLYAGCRPPGHQASGGLVPGDMITPGFDSS